MKCAPTTITLVLFLTACGPPQSASFAAIPSTTSQPQFLPAQTPEIPTPSVTSTPEATATATETFKPMELSTDFDHPVSCTYDDITSGRLAWSERQNGITFPSTATNKGWAFSGGTYPYYFIIPGGYKSPEDRPERFSSVCEIDTGFLSHPGTKLQVYGVQVLNVDGTSGFLHFLGLNERSNYKIENVFNLLLKSEGKSIGIALKSDYMEKYRGTKYWYLPALYEYQGEEQIMEMVDQLAATGKITSEMERVLFLLNVAPW